MSVLVKDHLRDAVRESS